MADFLDHLQNPDQRSNTWKDQRFGKFTSSNIHRLIGNGERLMTPEELKARPKKGTGSKTIWKEDPKILSDAAITYIKEVIAEEMTGSSNDGGSAATLWGEEYEQQGKEYFTALTGIEIIPCTYIAFSTIAGGSPDGDLPSVDSGFELKCPFNSRIHLDYFWLASEKNMKELFPEYYWQVQANMIWMKRPKSIFASYDPRQQEPFKMRILMIERNIDDQQLILDKIKLAQEKKEELIEQLKQIKSWQPVISPKPN